MGSEQFGQRWQGGKEVAMGMGKWGLIVLVAAAFGLRTAAAKPVPHRPAQSQAAQQSSDQTQSQKQDQKPQDPLAEAARRAREQKRNQPKAAKTWDNDNIPTTPGTISVVGESSSTSETPEKTTSKKTEPQTSPAASSETSAAGESSPPTGTDEERKAELSKQLAQAKEHLASVSTDFDILSRKYTLDQQTYYGKTGYSSDTEGAVKLKIEESQIASKKQEVADAQKQVDDLTAQLKGLEAGPAKPASPPQ